MKPKSSGEFIALVNESDEIVGADTKLRIHENGLLHREAAVILLNGKREMLLQKRMDDGTYTLSAGGHFLLGETYPQAAIRETKEEIGVILAEADLEKLAKIRMDFFKWTYRNNSFLEIFASRKNFRLSDFRIDRNDVESVEYMAVKEVKKLMEKKPELFGESFKKAFALLFNAEGALIKRCLER